MIALLLIAQVATTTTSLGEPKTVREIGYYVEAEKQSIRATNAERERDQAIREREEAKRLAAQAERLSNGWRVEYRGCEKKRAHANAATSEVEAVALEMPPVPCPEVPPPVTPPDHLWMLLGAGVGSGVGAVAGDLVGRKLDIDRGATSAVSAIVGALLGAAVGIALE